MLNLGRCDVRGELSHDSVLGSAINNSTCSNDTHTVLHTYRLSTPGRFYPSCLPRQDTSKLPPSHAATLGMNAALAVGRMFMT